MRYAAMILAVTISATTACTAHAADDLLALRSILIERLALMEHVAAHKWETGQAIHDPAREAAVVEAAVVRSRAAGFDPAVTRRVITAQIEAAKTLQRHYFEAWHAGAPGRVPIAPDLQTALRPEISRLSANLVAVVAASREQLETCSAIDVLRPIPPEFSGVSQAWVLAVEGVVGDGADCP